MQEIYGSNIKKKVVTIAKSLVHTYSMHAFYSKNQRKPKLIKKNAYSNNTTKYVTLIILFIVILAYIP